MKTLLSANFLILSIISIFNTLILISLPGYINHLLAYFFRLQEMTLPVLSMLRDVTRRHVFFIHHGNQNDCVDAMLAKVMTSLITAHIDFRFATVDSVLAAHTGFSVEQVQTLTGFF